MIRTRSIWLVFAALCCAAGGALAAGAAQKQALNPALPRTGELLYSSLCNEAQSGDDAGIAVRLVRSTKGDKLYLSWSEGALTGPMLATHLVLDPKTSRISFTIPGRTAPSYLGADEAHSGTISRTAIVLDGKSAPRVTRLPKGRLPACR